MQNWFKEMNDTEIVLHLQGLSNKAIEEMENKNKNQSIKLANEMDKKITILVEHISSIKGFYVGTDMYKFYEEMMYDMRKLINDTDKKMIEVYERLF